MSSSCPWHDLASDRQKVEHLELRIKITEDIDALKEQCFLEKKDLAATLDVVFKCLNDHLGPSAIFLQTNNEDLVLCLFTNGISKELLLQRFPHLLSVSKPERHVSPGLTWYTLPLDMAGETIGSFGMAFSPDSTRPENLLFDLLQAVAEELDDYFYAIQASRIKHMTIIEIQRSLKSKNLNQAVDYAVNMMSDAVPLQDLLVLYLDEDVEGRKVVQYLIYRDFQKLYDSVDKPMPEVEALIREGKDLISPGNRDLERIIPIDSSTETLLMDGLVNETLVGKMMVRPPDGTGLSISSREILQVFAEALRQRLVDYNREKNSLRHFFAPDMTRRLLKIHDYEKKHLAPHNATIGILYADIAGFTKICEQVLKDPDRIARFFDAWSQGVVENLFKESGCLDKFVGDCVIGLFGPPFHDAPPGQVVTRSLRTAVRIRDFTRDFFKLPLYKDIASSGLAANFGVSIGVNFCPASVGLLGPNHDLTAFSSGMNNTARLQGLATCNEILVTQSVKDIAEREEGGTWAFEGPFSATVKNVKDPMVYFKLKSCPGLS